MNLFNVRQNLIVIEGLDKVGKSTLISNLQSHPVFGDSSFYNFPSFKFDYLRKLTKDFENTTAYLRDLSHALSHGLTYLDMEQYLRKPNWVVCDRYYYSSLVYSDPRKMNKIEKLWMEPSPPIPKIIFYMYSEHPYPAFASSREDEDPNDSMTAKHRKAIHKRYIKLFTELEKSQGSHFIKICVDDKTPEQILTEFTDHLI